MVPEADVPKRALFSKKANADRQPKGRFERGTLSSSGSESDVSIRENQRSRASPGAIIVR